MRIAIGCMGYTAGASVLAQTTHISLLERLSDSGDPVAWTSSARATAT
jgi:hypothetical protein